jgi:hypothetical protein
MANTTNYNWETPDDTDLVKDGAAAIRTLGSSIDTTTKALNPETTLGDIAYRSATSNTNTRLPIGTAGQILAVSGGVPAWINNDQGDITEVQAGTGISVASGTGPVPTVSINTAVTADLTTAQTLTNKTLTSPVLTTPTISTIDAKGDLLVGTADNTIGRLAVGTNDYVLTAASGETTGLKWAAPAASTPTYVGCKVGNSSDISIANNTDVYLTFNSEKFDTDAFHSTSSNTGRITVPSGKAGYYQVYSSVQFLNNATGVRIIQLRKNGTVENYNGLFGNSSNRTGLSVSATIYGSVGDYFEVSVYQDSGTTLDVGAAETRLYFGADYLGV